MEVSIILMGKSSINGGVSIAMFDYERVEPTRWDANGGLTYGLWATSYIKIQHVCDKCTCGPSIQEYTRLSKRRWFLL
jgi:hypothetical protein